MTFNLNIKWGKEKLKDISCDTSEPPEVFKAILQSLTGVPTDRQKILIKGKTLKDEWKGISLKTGMTIMMMGSADKLFKAPENSTVFLEDLNQTEKQKVLAIPLGLENLGNTCYMNSVLQTLRSCPQLVSIIKKFNITKAKNKNDKEAVEITVALNNLLHNLDNSAEEFITPAIFWSILKRHQPHMGQTDPSNPMSFMQQDANECWTIVMRCLQSSLDKVNLSDLGSNDMDVSSNIEADNFINQNFGIEFDSELTCNESDSEPVTKIKETELQLSCFLDKEVKYLMSGIKNRLEEEIEKRAITLDKNVKFTKKSKISKLPAYLCVQMVRFYYKEGKNNQPGVNAKILKDVKFPNSLDLMNLCTEELQNKLQPGRNRFLQEDEYNRAEMMKLKENGEKPKEEEKSFLEYNSNFGDISTGSNCSGYYELYGVLTHKGRSSNSGHYVSWRRPDPLKDDWYLFDDENVSPVKEEQVLQLSGGGDWHMSYVLLYGPKRIRKFNADNVVKSNEEESCNATVEEKNESKTVG